MAIFESVHRFAKLLTELNQFCPEKYLVVGREMTKKFESFYRGSPAELLKQIKPAEIKGEFAVLIVPAK